jgi:hypothetical protein
MSILKIIPPAVSALIPTNQLMVTMENLQEHKYGIDRLIASLKNCPKLGETDGLAEHPAIFHYFYGATDIYICEFDREDTMFGYCILAGDLTNSEWGYFSLTELVRNVLYNIDYYWTDQSIEAALYNSYPKYFKMPKSFLGK